MNRNHVFKNISIEKNKHKKNKRRCSVVVKFTSINIKSNGKVNAIIQNRNLNWNPTGPNMLERTAETICIIKCEAIYLRFGTQKRQNCWVYWKIDRTWQYIYLSSIFFGVVNKLVVCTVPYNSWNSFQTKTISCQY